MDADQAPRTATGRQMGDQMATALLAPATVVAGVADEAADAGTGGKAAMRHFGCAGANGARCQRALRLRSRQGARPASRQGRAPSPPAFATIS